MAGQSRPGLQDEETAPGQHARSLEASLAGPQEQARIRRSFVQSAALCTSVRGAGTPLSPPLGCDRSWLPLQDTSVGIPSPKDMQTQHLLVRCQDHCQKRMAARSRPHRDLPLQGPPQAPQALAKVAAGQPASADGHLCKGPARPKQHKLERTGRTCGSRSARLGAAARPGTQRARPEAAQLARGGKLRRRASGNVAELTASSHGGRTLCGRRSPPASKARRPFI